MSGSKTRIHHPKPAGPSDPPTATLVVRSSHDKLRLILNYVLLMLLVCVLAYIAFIFLSLVPDCRRHALDEFFNPQVGHFLAP